MGHRPVKIHGFFTQNIFFAFTPFFGIFSRFFFVTGEQQERLKTLKNLNKLNILQTLKLAQIVVLLHTDNFLFQFIDTLSIFSNSLFIFFSALFSLMRRYITQSITDYKYALQQMFNKCSK